VLVRLLFSHFVSCLVEFGSSDFLFYFTNKKFAGSAGGIFIFWVADWFALMNDKMGGDLDKIQTVGKYFIEVWRAAGMDMSRVQ
jgi:tyrosyl-tRNA synthetase